MLDLNKMIMSAMKEKSPNLQTLKMLKAKKQEYETQKNVKIPYDDAVECNIIKKLAQEYFEEAKMFGTSGDEKTANEYKESFEFLSSLLPKEPTKEELTEYAKTIVTKGGNMGVFIKDIKAKFPIADGKVVSEIVKSLL